MGIEDGELRLDSFGDKWNVPLARVDWTAVCDRAVEELKKWPRAHATENAEPSKGEIATNDLSHRDSPQSAGCPPKWSLRI